MFHSATLKLTGWYLLILMVISGLFSVTIYGVATGEIRDRLIDFQNHMEQPGMVPPSINDPNRQFFTQLREQQRDAVARSLLLTLLYVNLLILSGGGVLSYLLARRTLGQIEEAHEAQSRFTSDASHELRTPLAAMKTELEVALRDPRLSKMDMQELLQSNLEEVNKLTLLSKTLLQLSKLDYSNLELERLNLSELTQEVVQRYDKNAKRIKLTIPKEKLVIKANVASIEELLTILVDNALKYSPAESQIKVIVSRQNRQAKFEITNKGEGIPPEKLPHIFDRFYRVNDSRNDGGAGLGLALAKEIITIHKGELTVSSAPGKATTFQVLLPTFRKNQA
jgi:two-component system sensor histidine kinase CiaH